MDYEQAEADIVARLAPFTGVGIDVIPLPETQAQFKRPFEKPLITVNHRGSRWIATGSDKLSITTTSEMSQDHEVTFEVVLQARVLRGALGIYNLKRQVIKALVGFTPKDCDALYAKEAGFTSIVTTLDDGVWSHTILFGARNVSVFDFEEDLSVIMQSFTNVVTSFPDDSFVVPTP